MPGKISVLPEDLTNKIAAGEVIERPASIVKELLENALDAGAKDIQVELVQGGCGSVRVTDNGEGMEADDAALAFSRYATSKIYQFDDIYRVRSFGFRGEALPSIASVARVEMVTRTGSSSFGTRVTAEGGEIRSIMETGCPAGTSILVSRIFDPVPVRRKFLKRELTEQGHCMDVITRLALSHPDVRMEVTAKGREILRVPAAKDAGERLAMVLGADFVDNMVSFSAERGGVELRGFASRPALTRASGRHIYIFVNRRFVRDPQVNHAVMTAYRHLIEGKRYPAAALFIEVPPQDVDVNVHPAKLEVRFRDPRLIYELVVETLTGALGVSPAAASPFKEGVPAAETEARDGRSQGVEEALKRYTLSATQGRYFPGRWVPQMREAERGRGPELFAGDALKGGETAAFSDQTYLGQADGTYLIFAASDRIIIVDQHAAHERVLFEKLKNDAGRSGIIPPSRRLLMPELIALPPRDFAVMGELLPLFTSVGFEMETFGNDTLVVKAIPQFLGLTDSRGAVLDFIAEYDQGARAGLEEKREKIFAFLACRGAVKAHQELSPAEAAALCKDLDAVSHAHTCPHGRPLFLSFSFRDIEKMFGRR